MNPLLHLASARNALDFALRNRLTWSPTAEEHAEAKPVPDAEERALLERYRLASARDRMTLARWDRNRSVLGHLERTLDHPAQKAFLSQRTSLNVLDVGCKNFDYVDALDAFWRRALSAGADRGVTLTGVELDAHRRYTDFRTRRAWGEHYCSNVPGARFVCGDVRRLDDTYDAISWFFPFVTKVPLLKWGLPLGTFHPLTLLESVLGKLSPWGVLIIVNHTVDELRLQHGLLRELGRRFELVGGEKPVTVVST